MARGETMRSYTLEEVAAAKVAWDLPRLSEASLGLTHQRYVHGGHASFALLTAWRDGEREEVNRAHDERLRQYFRSARCGLSALRAYYRREDTTWATDLWLWVHGIRRAPALKVVREYQQDLVVYAGPESGGAVQVMWLYRDRPLIGHVDRFPAFDAAELAAYFWHRWMAFEFVPGGFIEALLYQKACSGAAEASRA